MAAPADRPGFREETAIPKQLRAGMVFPTAFLIPPIRREGVMRTKLAIAVVMLGCLASAAQAEPATPAPPANPQVNIQQPEIALPMPRVRRPDPPVKIAVVKRPARPERHHRGRHHPEKPKQLVQRPAGAAKAKRPVTEAKEAKANGPAPEPRAKDQKAAASDATSAVRPPAKEKPASPKHRLREPSPAVVAMAEEPAAPPAPRPEAEATPSPRPELVTPPEQQPPEQQPTAGAEPHASEATPEQPQQTATTAPAAPADDQEERTLWWTHQGSPAVVRFRDCIAGFAVRNIARDNKTTWADLLIRAAEGECRQSFNEMARTLSARLGAEATEPVIRSLIETTFLPAARKAVSSTQRVAGGKSDPAPSPPAPMR
jgi:hypothetical protein